MFHEILDSNKEIFKAIRFYIGASCNISYMYLYRIGFMYACLFKLGAKNYNVRFFYFFL